MKNRIPVLLFLLYLVFGASSIRSQARMIHEGSECSSRIAEEATMDGHRQASKGEYDKALTSFLKAVRAEPSCAATYNNLGTGYYQLGRHSEALSAYGMALKFKPSWAWLVHFNIGRSLASLGQLKGALKSYDESIKLKGKDGAAYRARAGVNFRLGRSDQAASDAEKFLKIKGWRDKKSAYAVILAYFGFSQAGDKQAARGVLDMAASKGKLSDWPYPVVRFLREEINKQELLSVADDLSKLTEVRTYIGMRLILLGKKDEAQEHLEWVRENGKKNFPEYSLAVSELERME